MRCFINGRNEIRKTRPESIKDVFRFSYLVFLLSALPLNACPLCQEAISRVSGLAKGFYWSILLMLAVPLLVVSVISGIIINARRQSPPSQQ
jgi:hypothetical protein